MYLRIIYAGEGWMRCEVRNLAKNESERTWYDLTYIKEPAGWATDAGSRGGM